ncbi:hypothetical protein FIBSPDRAFT_497363 [Athelia psychrophila]|uniref:Uncharacterized protein n=1 Tax=Athelia psychrophila TaxID=1759441 RepID=A0A166KDQ5_9AGAM|nr:hypothetical protein FIBSPDRAFT_497363 [Fibularhizoctonia sp. CBS 109695]
MYSDHSRCLDSPNSQCSMVSSVFLLPSWLGNNLLILPSSPSSVPSCAYSALYPDTYTLSCCSCSRLLPFICFPIYIDLLWLLISRTGSSIIIIIIPVRFLPICYTSFCAFACRQPFHLRPYTCTYTYSVCPFFRLPSSLAFPFLDPLSRSRACPFVVVSHNYYPNLNAIHNISAQFMLLAA